MKKAPRLSQDAFVSLSMYVFLYGMLYPHEGFLQNGSRTGCVNPLETSSGLAEYPTAVEPKACAFDDESVQARFIVFNLAEVEPEKVSPLRLYEFKSRNILLYEPFCESYILLNVGLGCVEPFVSETVCRLSCCKSRSRHLAKACGALLSDKAPAQSFV